MTVIDLEQMLMDRAHREHSRLVRQLSVEARYRSDLPADVVAALLPVGNPGLYVVAHGLTDLEYQTAADICAIERSNGRRTVVCTRADLDEILAPRS